MAEREKPMPETKWTEEDLWAFIDREAPLHHVRAILADERSDPALAERIREMREEAAELSAAMDMDLAEPVPADLIRAVERASAPKRQSVRWLAPVTAMAATVALAVGIGAWIGEKRLDDRLAAMDERARSEQALLASVLQEGLERRLSGEAHEVAANDFDFSASLTPVKTYKSVSGHWCREFEEIIRRGGEDLRRRGVACRLDGGWRRVETVIEGEEAGRRL